MAQELKQIIGRTPQSFGYCFSRWTLKQIQLHCAHLIDCTSLSGWYYVLRSLGISRQRARSYIRSPDEQYELKLDYIHQILRLAPQQDTVVLFADETAYYDHASLSAMYAPLKQQPLAQLSYNRYGKAKKVVGALNPMDGRVFALQYDKVDVAALMDFYQRLCEFYPQVKIYLIEDNHPIHGHPELLLGLVKQTTPFEFRVPPSWKNLKPKGTYAHLQLPIQIVQLPTYASWLNPIEKYWKRLKQQLIHLHDFTFNFNELVKQVDDFLAQSVEPSIPLLRYVGLLNPNGIYKDILTHRKIT